MTKYIWINEQPFRAEEVVYDIIHEGKVVATLNNEDEVWNYFNQKEDEVIKEKGRNWSYSAIGAHGLVMSDKTSPGWKIRLEWSVQVRKKPNEELTNGRNPD